MTLKGLKTELEEGKEERLDRDTYQAVIDIKCDMYIALQVLPTLGKESDVALDDNMAMDSKERGV